MSGTRPLMILLSLCVPLWASELPSGGFLYSLAIIESQGDAQAVGDGGRAVGAFQIWPVYVAEANRISKLRGYPGGFTLEDRKNIQKSAEMTIIVLDFWRKYHNIALSDWVALASLHRRPCAAWNREYLKEPIEIIRNKKIRRMK